MFRFLVRGYSTIMTFDLTGYSNIRVVQFNTEGKILIEPYFVSRIYYTRVTITNMLKILKTSELTSTIEYE